MTSTTVPTALRLPNLEAYHRPASVAEAVELLAAEGAFALGGGTRLVASGDPRITHLVDVTRLGLGEVHEGEDGLTIGATVRVQRLAEAAGVLGRAATATYFSRFKRNQATAAGETIAAGRQAYLSTLLLACGATLAIEGVGPVPLERVLEQTVAAGGRAPGLATGIAVPKDALATADFEALTTVPTASPLVLVAAAIVDGSTRIAISGGIDVPVATGTSGVDPGAAADAAAAIYDPPDRPWASRGYAIEMSRVCARRVVERIASNAQGGAR